MLQYAILINMLYLFRGRGGEIVQTSTASINLKAIQIYYNSVLIC